MANQTTSATTSPPFVKGGWGDFPVSVTSTHSSQGYDIAARDHLINQDPVSLSVLISDGQGYQAAGRRIVPPLKIVVGKLYAGPALHDGADDDLPLHAGKS